MGYIGIIHEQPNKTRSLWSNLMHLGTYIAVYRYMGCNMKIIGVRIDPKTGNPDPPEDERENFYICAACGQAVDKRDLGQVLHHEDEGHVQIDMNS